MRVACVFAAVLIGVTAGRVAADEKEIVAAIEKLGGAVGRDNKKADKPISWVSFNGKGTDEAVKLATGLKTVRYVNLQGSDKITVASLKELKALPDLDHLDLRRTAMTDEDVKELKGFKQLRILDLSNTKVTDEGLKELKGLDKLESLRLIGTKVTDKGLDTITAMKALTSLNVFQTDVTQAGADKLKKARPKMAVTR
jgi:hypothetical protein